VISGGDTNIIGSQITGKQVSADVGDNLNIVSVQDDHWFVFCEA
jgi:filamentous hemagglutinin